MTPAAAILHSRSRLSWSSALAFASMALTFDCSSELGSNLLDNFNLLGAACGTGWAQKACNDGQSVCKLLHEGQRSGCCR
jgi:hypothetical protein